MTKAGIELGQNKCPEIPFPPSSSKQDTKTLSENKSNYSCLRVLCAASNASRVEECGKPIQGQIYPQCHNLNTPPETIVMQFVADIDLWRAILYLHARYLPEW